MCMNMNPFRPKERKETSKTGENWQDLLASLGFFPFIYNSFDGRGNNASRYQFLTAVTKYHIKSSLSCYSYYAPRLHIYLFPFYSYSYGGKERGKMISMNLKNNST